MIEMSQLKEMATFQGIGDEALGKLAEIFQKRVYKDQDPVYNENTEGSDLYLVAHGAVKVSKLAKEGGVQSLGSLKEGGFFGTMTFLAGGRHSTNVQANGDCTIFTLERRAFDDFVEKYPADAVKLYTLFTKQLIDTVRQMNDRYIDLVNYMWRWR